MSYSSAYWAGNASPLFYFPVIKPFGGQTGWQSNFGWKPVPVPVPVWQHQPSTGWDKCLPPRWKPPVPVNRPPDAKDDYVAVHETRGKVTKIVNVLANDRDPDGDRLTIKKVFNVPAGVKVDILHDGQIKISFKANQIQDDFSFGYTVKDGKGGEDSATVHVNVANVDVGPGCGCGSGPNPPPVEPPHDPRPPKPPKPDPKPPVHPEPPVHEPKPPKPPKPHPEPEPHKPPTDKDVAITVITNFYYKYLHRAPDKGGLDFWVNEAIKNGVTTVTLGHIEHIISNSKEAGGHIDTPLVLDLDRDGVQTIALNQSDVLFDIDNDGVLEHTAWFAADEHILALDRNGNGSIDNQAELFGNSDGYIHGFARLAAHDENADGVINADDSVFADLQIWQDLNSNGISEEGELSALAGWGVEEISLDAALVNFYENGQLVSHESTATLSDGSVVGVHDVWFENVDVDIADILDQGDELVLPTGDQKAQIDAPSAALSHDVFGAARLDDTSVNLAGVL